MKEKKNTVLISLRIDREMYNELKKISKELAIPYTSLIKHAINEWLKNRGLKR